MMYPQLMDSQIKPLRCAYCGIIRPADNQPCPACQRPRFRHKTADAAEFWARKRELDEHGY
jgi:hypothetical protein